MRGVRMKQLEFTAGPADAGQRMDQFLAGQETGLSRSALGALAQEGRVFCNDAPAGKSQRLKEGDRVRLDLPPAQPSRAQAQDIPLEVVYEDGDLLVVNKPKGMVVHPAPGSPDGTLVNALLSHCGSSLSGIGGELRPGIVHRIDKDTSGLLVVAKNDAAHTALSAQMAVHSIRRVYQAVVYGRIRENGFVEAPIARHRADRKRMAIDAGGKYAYTAYEVLANYREFTHIACRLKTGRTHQIRVHLASIGHPVAGDPVYGPKKVLKSLEGQCLHAKTLGFVHPSTGQYLEFDSPLPPYFTRFLAGLGPREE